jgi:thiamine biosynthesis lipoprotein
MDTLLSPRRRTVLQALGAAAVVTGCGDWRGRSAVSPFEFRGPTMGTTYTVKIAAPGLSDAGRAEARAAVEGALDAVVARMSAYLPDSELTRFNRHLSTTPFALSPDTLAVFATAQRVSALTGGAFDVTVAPIVDAWGFGPSKARRLVAAAELGALAPRVGYRMLAVDAAAGTATKTRADLQADLSGVAKGYGVDRAALALEALGITDYMVEAGGELRTRGVNAEGQPWQIGIEQPDAVPPRARHVVPLSGQAMATSGDYRIYFERDGHRYSHEIEPATGLPIRHGLASVSVVAPDCAFADAMATALIVLGPDKGHALARREGIAAYFVTRHPDGSYTDRQTPGFAALGGRRAVG